jgi:hypothetical protein
MTKDLDVCRTRGDTTEEAVGGGSGISFMEEALITENGVPRAVVRDYSCGKAEERG